MPDLTPPSFRDTLFALEAQGDLNALIAFLHSQPHDPNAMLFALCDLLAKDHCMTHERLRSTFVLAMMLANTGYRHPVISLVRAAGGIVCHSPEERDAGLRDLPAQMDSLDAAEQARIVHHLLYPVLLYLLTVALQQADNTQVLYILELLKGAVPLFRTLFDWDAPVQPLSLAEIRQRGREQARLVTLSQPPPGAERRPRRVVVAPGQVFVPPDGWVNGNGATGERIATAMQAYGWQAEIFQIQNAQREESCRALAAFCRQRQPDILIFDDNALIEVPAARADMIRQVRQDTPSVQVVGCLLDAWTIQSHRLRATVDDLDLVWTAIDSPARPLWDEPAFVHKVMHSPFPPAGQIPVPVQPLQPQMRFSGRLNGGNWHRAFWFAAAEKRQLPFTKQLTGLDLEGLSPLASYRRYLQGLTEATCAINFVMRPNHATAVIGRTFEIPWSGSLMIQEATPEMRYYFIPGEHYLEFSSVAELSAIAQFITHHREEAEEIRRRGHAFAWERYNDATIIGHIDRRLYFP